ncbi:MAG: hypothetical protein Udaeo2_22560 [Candidatus Udaeobacter sp.]|nr:MAG: hypothetical protein Udaeo2_22560 [Candidatus Udaeobacter sp.]
MRHTFRAVGQKFRATRKNERRISRTGTKPIRGKIDFLYLNPTSGPGRMSEVLPKALVAQYYASTKPGYRRATKFRPTIEEIF